MAEERDQSQQTEQPTQHRLEEARRRGQVASSKEVTSFLLLGVTLLAWAALAPAASSRFTLAMAGLLGRAGTLLLDQAGTGQLLAEAAGIAALAVAAPLLLYLAAPVVAAALQGALLWSTANFGLKLDRLSPIAGLGRLLSPRSLVEFLKGLVKLGLVGAVLFGSLWPERDRILSTSVLGPDALLDLLRALVQKLLVSAAAAAALLAILDYAHARFALMRQLRMSRREVMDEMKQNDGDPVIKQRLKSIRMQRARRRMMADVPKSTVVITNPTHYAVALRYVAGETPAPQVMAKGVDDVARRIRELATEHQVPVVENPPLARALHAACEIGSTIPPAYYQAVDEIVGYVMRLSAAKR